MDYLRKQLTLFLTDQQTGIEKIRAEFNPIQYELIAAHVTLCREDEIEPLGSVLQNLTTIQFDRPVCIEFDPIERFENGKGVLLPAKAINNDFHELRKKVLMGIHEFPRMHHPHITLMHPRNSTCSDALFEQLQQHEFPALLYFNEISLIAQKQDGKWEVLQQFPIC